jgi:hypothetical protein
MRKDLEDIKAKKKFDGDSNLEGHTLAIVVGGMVIWHGPYSPLLVSCGNEWSRLRGCEDGYGPRHSYQDLYINILLRLIGVCHKEARSGDIAFFLSPCLMKGMRSSKNKRKRCLLLLWLTKGKQGNQRGGG